MRRHKTEILLCILLLIITAVISLCFLLLPDKEVRHYPADERMTEGTAVIRTKTGIRRAYYGEKILGYTLGLGTRGEFIPVELVVTAND